MKNFLVCGTFMMIIGAALSAQTPVVADVPPAPVLSPLTPDEERAVGGIYSTLLAEAQGVRIANRLVLEKGMNDYRFQARDWADIEKAAALCDALNIDWIARPQIYKRITNAGAGSEIILSAVLFNVRTKNAACTAPVALQNVNEARSKVPALIADITRIVNGGAPAGESAVVYNLGDRGPGGGYVFYAKRGYSDGWRYLEVAPRSTEQMLPKAKYYEYLNNVFGISKSLGNGKQLAELIAQATEDYQIVKAAKICANLRYNWLNDWFLPNIKEMEEVSSLVRYRKANLGEFRFGSYYWTSYTGIYGGDQGASFYKTGEREPSYDPPERYIRAIRQF